MGEEERSPSGSPIHRHRRENPKFQPAERASPHGERLEAHLRKFLGEASDVFHEIVSEFVHIDVYVYPPAAGRDYVVLVSNGMSRLPMTVPPELPGRRWAELTVFLPPNWPLTEAAIRDERNYWPLRWLKTLARLPHEYRTWLGPYHTVPNGDPARPFAGNTELCCWLLVPPVLLGKGFPKVDLPGGEALYLYNLVPIHRSEMEFKLQHGADALVRRLWDANALAVIDTGRKPVS
jgi:hypothetical protein